MSDIVGLLVEGLGGFELPPLQEEKAGPTPTPDERRRRMRATLKSSAIAVLKSAGKFAVSQAASMVPFGSIAVAFCEDTMSRIGVLTENKEAVKDLAFWAKEIAARGDKLVVVFSRRNDDKGVELAESMAESTFYAFRIARDAQFKPGMISAVVYYLGCNRTAQALDRASTLVKDTALLATLYTADKFIEDEEAKRQAPTALLAADDLQQLDHCPDAKQFWSVRRLGPSAGLEMLLESLDSFARKQGVLTRENSGMLENSPQLRRALATDSDNETVSLSHFAKFLNGHASLAAALASFLPGGAAGDEQTTTAERLARLRQALRPVDSGELISIYQSTFAKGTREWVFASLEDWAQLPSDKPERRVFWLQGTGGLGKSVIAAQMVRRYGTTEDDAAGQAATNSGKLKLAGYFFCKFDGSTARHDPRRVLTTLAYRLTGMVPEYAAEVHKRLADGSSEPSLSKLLEDPQTDVSELFKHLLLEPLTAALQVRGDKSDIFLLIDALDELQRDSSRQQLLGLIANKLTLLPPQVRFIITSRPENDIVAFFRDLGAFIIDKEDEKQAADMRIYAEAEIIRVTGLNRLESDVKDQLLKDMVQKADGVFLAISLMAGEIKKLEKRLAADGKPLTAADVRSLLASTGDVIDGTYTATLDRIQLMLESAAKGSAEVRASLEQLRHDLLAVLLAARQPLRQSELNELAGGDHARMPDLTDTLMNALSLLYSAANDNAVIRPLHKTVADFLMDIDPKTGLPHSSDDHPRAGRHFVDVQRGHVLLAKASLRIMLEADLLPAGDVVGTLVQPEKVKKNNAVAQYAIAHGHVHLTECIKSCADKTAPLALAHAAEQAVQQWQQKFLSARTATQPLGLPRDLALSATQATAAFGAWLLLQAHTMARKYDFFPEVAHLAQTLQRCGGYEVLCQAMVELWRTFGTGWLPHSQTAISVAWWVQDVPATSVFWRSACEDWVVRATEAKVPLWVRPLTVGINPQLNTLVGHTEPVNAVALSSEGQHIVSGSSDGTVRVWEAATGKLLQTLECCPDGVFDVVLTSDDSRVVSACGDNTVQIWEISTGKLLQTLEGHTDWVMAVAVSSDGSRIVSSSDDKSVRVWEAASGTLLQTFDGGEAVVRTLSVDSTGSRIFRGQEDGTIHVYDAANGHLLQTLQGHTAGLSAVAVSSDDSRIVSGSDDMTVRVWDASTGQLLQTLEGHTARVVAVAISNDGRRLASAALDETVRVWDLPTGRLTQTLKGHAGDINAMAMSSDGSRIVSGGYDHTLRVWEGGGTLQQAVEGHLGEVSAVAVDRDGSRVASASEDKTIRLWEAGSGKLLQVLEGHSAAVKAVCFSSDGSRIVSASHDHKVQVWETATGRLQQTLEGHDAEVEAVAMSSDDMYIVTGGADNNVRVWEAATGCLVRTLKGHTQVVYAVAISRDGGRIVSGGNDRSVRLWKSSTGKLQRALKDHTGQVVAVAVNSDGTIVVSGSWDDTVRVWNATNGKLLQTLSHGLFVSSVALSSDGRRIISGSGDRMVRVWEAATGKLLQTLEGHTNDVQAVALSDNGKIVSGGSDRTVRVWETRVEIVSTSSGVVVSQPNQPSRHCCLL